MGSYALRCSLVLVIALASAGDAEAARRRPNVILISIDSLRPDHLGTYGYPKATDPSLQTLAADGIVFDTAYSTSSWTLPAHVSMLTSLYPEGHGVVRPEHGIPEALPLLSELLAADGYACGAIVSGPFLAAAFGYDRGWDFYDDSIGARGIADSHRGTTSEHTHEKAVDALQRLEEPFFLFLHYWDVHYDYAPPAPYDSMFDSEYQGSLRGESFETNPRLTADMPPEDLQHLRGLYDGEIRYTDEYLGRFFDVLRKRGLYRGALIIVTADHGDEFFEHGNKGHRKNLFNTSLSVPLIVKLPGNRRAGTRRSGPVSVVDVPPTVAALTGTDFPPSFQGVPLFADPVLRGRRFVAADLHGKQKALVSPTWKALWWRGGGRLYRLDTDPDERRNLRPEDPEMFKRLQEEYAAWEETMRGADGGEPTAVEIDESLHELLHSLGYI